jgi:hypothetical protein
MSDSGDVQQLAKQLAEQGREVLVEQLSSAYADAAAAHADVVSIDQSRIDALVQRAADRADGLQWRRALASAASAQLGISVVDAMSHPAVAQAQNLAEAPSYEDGLSKLLARPIQVPSQEPAAASTPEPGDARASDAADKQASTETVIPGQEELFSPSDPAPAEDDEGHSDHLAAVEVDDSVVDLLPGVDPGEFAEPEPEAAAAAGNGADEQPDAAEDQGDDAPAGKSQVSDQPAADTEQTYVAPEEEAAAQFTEDEVAQADAPTQTYDASKAAAAADAPEAPDADAAADEDAAPSPLAGLAKAKPVIDPHATQIHDMAAEFAAQDQAEAAATTKVTGPAADLAAAAAAQAAVPAATEAARKPEPGQGPRRPAPARPSVEPDPEATAVHPAPQPAPAPRTDPQRPPRRPGAPVRPPAQRVPEPAPLPDEDEFGDELRIAAVHLGGVANLPTHGEPLDVRISEAGLDILQANEEILGRLQWSDIGRLEASAPKGRLLGKNKGGSRLVVRTKHGDASFEIPDMDPEELRAEVAEMSARYGR